MEATTLREFLTYVASIFVPLGFLAPMTLFGKLILQATYLDEATLDTPLKSELLTKWRNMTQSLINMPIISIPRCLKGCSDRPTKIWLHGYSDASKEAIAAYVYGRFEFENVCIVVSSTSCCSHCSKKQNHKAVRCSSNSPPRTKWCPDVLSSHETGQARFGSADRR